MSDLALARRRLHEGDLALVVVKGSRVLFEGRERGVLPFVTALESLGRGMAGASVADRVVGRAVALLCAYAGVRAVYACVLSFGARRVLEDHGIYSEWEELVERVLNASRGGPCPFERAVESVSSPEEAYAAIKEAVSRLGRGLAQPSAR